MKKNKSSNKNLGKEWYTLVNLFPKTGRTHQLRVHLKHLRHPIVADKLYLKKKRYQADLKWCERHFLHAVAIEFRNPTNGKMLQVSASIPNDLETALGSLEQE